MNLAATMSLDAGRFLQPLNAARSALGGFTGAVSTLGNIGNIFTGIQSAIGLAKGAFGPFSEAIKAAANNEDLATTFRTLLGDARLAAKAMKEATDFADATPFDPEPVQQGYKTLLAYGFALKDVKTLMTDAGDLASVMKVELGDVTRVFGRLKSGDFGEAFERLRDFGISKDDLVGKGLVFDRGGSFKGTAAQAMEAVSAIIREKFGGTMDSVSKTWNGKMSTLAGYIDAIKREFGAPIKDALKPALEEAISLAKRLSETARDWGGAIGNAASMLMEAFKSDQLGDLIGNSLKIAFGDAVNFLVGALKTGVDVLAGIIPRLFSGDFIGGVVAAWEAIGARMTQILLTAFETPIRSIQAGIQYAIEKAMESLGRIPGVRDLLGLKDFTAGGFGEIYDQTEANLFGRNSKNFEAQALEAANRSQELLTNPFRDVADVITNAFANFGPADIFGVESLKSIRDEMLAGLATKAEEAAEARKKNAQAFGGDGGAIDGSRGFGMAADHLAKVGLFLGGGHSAEQNEQRRTNDFMKKSVDLLKVVATNTKNKASVEAVWR